MSRAASIPRFFFVTRATVVVVVKNLLNAKSESVKMVTLPRPFLANSADTHTDRRQTKQAGWDWGAAHTQPSKIKKSLATRTNNCCVAAARTGSKTENIERRRRNERERTERKTIHTCLNKNKKTTTTHGITPHSPQTTTAGRTHRHT